MSRRLSLTMLLGLITAAVLSFGLTAGAAPDEASGESELEAAQRHLAELRIEEAAARAAHDDAVVRMGELETEIAATARDLEAAEAELAEAQRQLQELVAQMYTSGTVSYLDVLVGADDFSEFANQLQVWVDLIGQQRATFDDLLSARDSLAEQKAQLENQRDQQAAALADADAQVIEAEGLEGEAQAYLDSLNAQLREEMEAEQARQAEHARIEGEKLAAKLAADQAAAQEAAEGQAAAQEAAAAQQADLAAEAAAAREADREAELRAAQLYAEQKAEEEEQARIAAEQAAADEAAAEELAELRAAAEKAERLAKLAEEQEAAQAAAAEQAELDAEKQAELDAEKQAELDAAAEQARLDAEKQAELDADAEQQFRTAQEEQDDDASQEGQQYSTTQDDASQGGATTPEGTTSSGDDQYGLRGGATTPEGTTSSSDDQYDGGPSTGAMGAQPSTGAAGAQPSTGGGGEASCADDFGGVQAHVAQAGCDLQDKFGLRVTGIGYSDYHWDGLDLDIWTSDVTLGNQVRDYALANYAVEYTCWQDRYVNNLTGWEEGCAGHMDHVHITFSP